jgi:periplasmic copper chaperone A
MHAFYRRLGLAATIAISFGLPAAAHITFENKTAKPGSTVKFILRVPHGCAGAATTGIRIALPETLSEAKPQPKSGWTISLVADDVQKASAGVGQAHEGAAPPVKEISWSGGRLEDAYYDEFVFRATVSKTASGPLFVPVIQQCDGSTERWIEIPANGASSEDLKNPAPLVRIEP